MAKQLFDPFVYLSYDSTKDRKLIISEEWDRKTKLIIFDELHKMKKWNTWIKGIYDTEGIPPAILVTGSARLETYKKGGDSLAERFFHYRLHPFTIKEITANLDESAEDALEKLILFGGFPEPYLKNSETFAKRWRRSHIDRIIREDLLDLEKVRDIKSIEIMIDLLRARVGSTTSYSSLARDLQVSVHTVKHWLQILENLYIIFPVRPFHKNITRSIIKETKYYFYDNGAVDGDLGAKLENIVACSLIKELQYLEDTTGCHVALNFIRDKEKREVDFIILIDHIPKLLVEVKSKDDNFSPHLFRFQKMLNVPEAIQVVYKLRHKKSKENICMVPIYEFLNDLSF